MFGFGFVDDPVEDSLMPKISFIYWVVLPKSIGYLPFSQYRQNGRRSSVFEVMDLLNVVIYADSRNLNFS
jgi:hypothetical protein